MAVKEDRRTKMTKGMLKNSLLELLKTVSIHQVSIRELCTRADVNRSTFYKYYGSQYELLAEMEDDWLQSIEKNMCHITRAEDVPFTDILIFLEENMELSRLLANSNVDPEFPQKIFNLPSVKKLIDKNFSAGEKGNVREFIHHFYVNGAYSVLKCWLNKEERESPQEMARIMFRVLEKVRI